MRIITATLVTLLFCVAAKAQTVHVTGPNAEQYRQWCVYYINTLQDEWLGKRENIPCRVNVRITHTNAADTGATTYDYNSAGLTSADTQISGRPDSVLKNTLPHEMFHIVLGNHFKKRIPRWLDEGAACNTESDPHQLVRFQDHVKYLSNGSNRAFSFNTMRTTYTYPRDVYAFYVQSYTMTRFLILHRDKPTYMQFAMTGGSPAALKEIYGYEDYSDYQISYLDWLKSGGKVTVGQANRWTPGVGWT